MPTQDRHLAAILFTDIVGYTALMQHDETNAVRIIKRYHEVLKMSVSNHHGEILNNYGDGSLCAFNSVYEALKCAIELQTGLNSEPIVPLRVGLHLGEILFENGQALGDDVNVASRIQSLGVANSILLSSEVCHTIKNHPEFTAISLGKFDFKNVDEPMEVFALNNNGFVVPDKKNMEGKLQPKKSSPKKWMLVASALVVLVFAGYFIYPKLISDPVTETIDKSIAVLPFVDMSAVKDQEYFSDGLSEELLNLLSKIPELKVIGRTSSFSFKGKNEDLRSIAKKLGVAHVLEGSVRKDENKIRVTAQLIRATDGSHLWSETYDRDLEGIFQLQDDIAGAVVKQLKLKLLTPTTNVASSTNTEVYNLILQGNYFAEKRDKENIGKALDFYLKALAIDSLNARSWAAVANYYVLQTSWGLMDKNLAVQKAKNAATKSIELDNNQAEGHSALGQIKLFGDFDYVGAEVELKKALNLQPGNADLLRTMGMLYRCTGRYDEGIALTKRSLNLDPVKPITYFHYAHLLLYANQLDDAIAAYNKTLELNPKFPRSHIFLGIIYLLQGKNNLALAEMPQEENEAWRSLGLILTYHRLGREKEVNKMIRAYVDKYQKEEPYQIAQIYAFRGDKDKAFEWLQKSYDVRYVRLNFLKGDPLLKNLEGDPRHTAFLKKMNLPL